MPSRQDFPGDLLTGPAEAVARLLLGCTLTHLSAEGTVSVLLTEVEAYHGESDPASHAFRGRTARNEVMFGPAGHLYVYRSHGLHWCANLVTGPEGEAAAVLLRAGRVVAGEDLARRRRGPKVAAHALARGPGCLAQALGIDDSLQGATVLSGSALVLSRDLAAAAVGATGIAQGPRVGVSRAADVEWRWWFRGDRSVSAYRRSPRAPSPPS